MGTVAGQRRNQQRGIEEKRTRRIRLAWALALFLGVGCCLYVTRPGRQPGRRLALEAPKDAAALTVETPAMPPIPTAADANKMNINTATFEMLDSLPGVGSVTARAIVQYRELNGGFRELEELRNVRGIGQEKFRWLEGLVTV